MPSIKTLYYQHYDADHSLDVPAEAFGGWMTGEIDIDLGRTALVVMHAWDPGTLETHAAWWRTVEYLPRAKKILEEVFPPLLTSVRNSPMKVFHVWSGREKCYTSSIEHRALDIGHRTSDIDANDARALRTRSPIPDPRSLTAWRSNHVFVGQHNIEEVNRCLDDLDIAPQALPITGEAVAINGSQLHALCQEHDINHLIYVGFAINWCLLMSPGGMVDMSRYGIICSTIPEAVTAVENKETAREEHEKQQALWRVSLEFGFVFPSGELLAVISSDS
jgi:nicotinamidase-related amidase